MLLGIFISLFITGITSCGTNAENNPAQNVEIALTTPQLPVDPEQNEISRLPLNVHMDSIESDHEDILAQNAEATEIVSQLPESIAPNETECSQSNNQSKIVNYAHYLKKIWVGKDWDGGAYDYPLSFFISKIDNGVIEGKFLTRAVAYPDFYYYRFDSSVNDFTGTIHNEIAECQFIDKSGNRGNAVLIFMEGNEIEVEVKYSDISEIYKGSLQDGNYLFRPHNITDIEGDIKVLKMDSFAAELDYWGNVSFVTMLVDTERVWYPAAYLANENNDILYKFSAPFQTATEIIDVEIGDINKDGLKYVKIVTGFVDYETGLVLRDMPQIERIFFQMNDGTFCDSDIELHNE